jgi:protein-S-isoprenylcysteine O-methyltransferase Ste14
MPLREDLEREGAWLFRWRSALPPLAAALVVAGATLHEVYLDPDGPAPTRAHEIAWLVLGLIGFAVRVGVAGHVPKRTSGRNTGKGQVADSLNTTGLYSLCRHPLYFGNFLLWIACIGVAAGAGVAVVAALLFWLFYERVMLAEEAFLRVQFGEAFLAWASRTSAFLPRLSGWVAPEMRFCWRTAVKREYTSAFAYLLAFAAFANLARAAASLRLQPDPVWAAVLAAGGLGFLITRLLRKRGILSVEGR